MVSRYFCAKNLKEKNCGNLQNVENITNCCSNESFQIETLPSSVNHCAIMECLTNIFAVKKISTSFQGRKQKIFHRVQQLERTLVSMPATENI